MNITRMKAAQQAANDHEQNELHDWIDAEVLQTIDDKITAQNIQLDKKSLKLIEKEITKLLKECFK